MLDFTPDSANPVFFLQKIGLMDAQTIIFGKSQVQSGQIGGASCPGKGAFSGSDCGLPCRGPPISRVDLIEPILIFKPTSTNVAGYVHLQLTHSPPSCLSTGRCGMHGEPK